MTPSLCRFLVTALVLASPVPLSAAVAWRRIDSSPDGVLPAPNRSVEPTAALAVDVDKDGDADLIMGGRNSAPALTLWRYDAGRWTMEVIEPDDVRIEAGGAIHDIDGDGDSDLVFGGDFRSPEIWWWENPHPAKGRWTRRPLKRDAVNQHHDQIFGDFDGDKKPELVAWNQRSRSLLRFRIPADPKTDALWPVETIFSCTDGTPPEGLAAADIDGDNVTDIVGGGYWFKHVNGRFAANIVDPTMAYSRAAAAQFVKGGRPEIVFGPGDADGPVKLYQWDAGKWVAHTLVDHIIHGHSLEVADIDGDGNLDLMLGEMGSWSGRVNNPTARVVVFFGDGAGKFRSQVVNMGQGVHECRVADLDGDGDLDIFAKPFRHHAPRLVVWMNEGPVSAPLALDKWERHLIDDMLPGKAKRLFVDAVDLDGDGKRDLVSGGMWHRNPGQLRGTWEKRTIGDGFLNFATAYDFDRDGDIDLLGTTSEFQGNQFALALNDGRGGFTVRKDLPAGTGDFLQGVTTARLQNNMNAVVLSWHKNTSGLEALVFSDDASKWELKILSPFSRNEQVTVGDIDRDSGADLLLGDHWLRNTGTDWTQHEMGKVSDLNPKAEVDRNKLVDINGDGWLDAVVSLELDTHVVWFEHPGKDATGPWKRHIIAKVPGQGFSMDVADFDADGDFDVVVGEHRNPEKNNRVVLLENSDGRGGSWREHIIDQGAANVIDHHDGTVAVDVDGDGDIDLASIGFYNSKVWVLENKAIDRKR